MLKNSFTTTLQLETGLTLKATKVINWKQKFITWETRNQTTQHQMSDKTKEFF